MKTNLCIAHEESFWPFIPWPKFRDMKAKETKVVIVPIVSLTDWGMGLPLDFEEILTMSLIKQCLLSRSDSCRFLVIPPLSFNLGKKGKTFFATDPSTAHQCIESVVTSIKDSGFRKILFINSSPWNEDLIDAAGRDLRISQSVQPFIINLGSLGLSFTSHPDRQEILEVAAYLLKRQIIPPKPEKQTSIVSKFFPGEERLELEKPLKETKSDVENSSDFSAYVQHLSGLLSEVYHFRPLNNDGIIPNKLHS